MEVINSRRNSLTFLNLLMKFEKDSVSQPYKTKQNNV